MKTRWIAAAAALTVAGSAQAVVASTGGGFDYELLDFSGTGSSVLHPTGPCSRPGSTNYRCDPMTFDGGLGGDISVTAGGTSVAYQDLQQTERGLGAVAGPNANGSTWISGGEVLKFDFANAVNLVGYHVYQTGDARVADHFMVSSDQGNTWTARSFASVVFNQWHPDQWLTNSHSFWFKAEDNERFYVGAVKITSAIPEPQTYALLLAGLGVVGFVARRRRPQQ